MQQNLRRTFLIFITASVFLSLYVYEGIFFNESFYDEPENSSLNKNAKIILFWQNPTGIRLGSYTNCSNIVDGAECWTTRDRKMLTRADLVFFHPYNMEWSGVNAWKNYIWPRVKYPPSRHRRADQLWVVDLAESPANTENQFDYNRINCLFNATSSYHKKADVRLSYTHMAIPRPGEPTNYSLNKSALVYWVVSNCNSPTNRMAFYNELRQYVQIDAFGRCFGGAEPTYGKRYKFYLALENSRCYEYITEKMSVWGFNNWAIPIVRGACEFQYRKSSPPNSFIFADNYTPKELGAYLNYLDKNDTAFNEYFKWRKSNYTIRKREDFVCKLCRLVNRRPKFTGVVDNIFEVHGVKRNCWKDGEEKTRCMELEREYIQNVFKSTDSIKQTT